MHPYREACSPPVAGVEDVAAEDWTIAVVLAAIGLARVAVAVVRGEGAGTDVTVAGLLGAIGCVLLVRFGFAARRA